MGVTERKEREKHERRRAILNTAKELIREIPFEDITMEEIAKRLELSRATLYLYFRNKSEIFATLLTEGMEELEKGYRDATGHTRDAMDRMLKMAVVFFTFYQKNHAYFDLIVTKRSEMLKEVGPEVLESFNKAGTNVITPIAEAYRAGMDAGKFLPREPEKMAYLLRAVAIGIAVGVREGKFKFPDDIGILQEFVLHGVMKN